MAEAKDYKMCHDVSMLVAFNGIGVILIKALVTQQAGDFFNCFLN